MTKEKCCICHKEFETKVVITKNKGKSYCSDKCWNSGN